MTPRFPPLFSMHRLEFRRALLLCLVAPSARHALLPLLVPSIEICMLFASFRL
jgi:hypothetical protein